MPNIITPYKETEIVVPGSRLAGHVKIKKIDKHGRETFRTEFKNLITDVFLQTGAGNAAFIGGTNQYLWAINVGTGVQTTPQPTDTSLGNFIGAAYLDQDFGSIKGTVLGATPDQDYKYIECETTFDYPDAIGDLTEIGLSCGESPGDPLVPTQTGYLLVGKALIKDSSGNPVVVTKTDAEKLVVSYELRVYRPSETPFQVNIGGTMYDFMYNTVRKSSGLSPFLGSYGDNRGSLRQTEDYLGYIPNNSLYAVANNGLSREVGGPFYVQVSPSPNSARAVRGLYVSTSSTDAASPYTTSTVRTGAGNVYVGDFACVDTATGNINTFNLPLGYRLDYSFTLNRTRV